MGGEKVLQAARTEPYRGSPPRGRGKGSVGASVTTAGRITPAWAGKRLLQTRDRDSSRDHPRVGGEKLLHEPPDEIRLGSPPRGRGKVRLSFLAQRPARITPAWAGKSLRSRSYASKEKDHPRVGGEKPLYHILQTLCWGSPPRGRGKGVIIVCEVCCRGITPAWAGKSSLSRFRPFPSEDHPRVGGEKLYAVSAPYARSGSPPRGRGKDIVAWRQTAEHRITPAWAGKR